MGTAVPGGKKFLGTDGYRPEKKFWVPMGTGKIFTYADPWQDPIELRRLRTGLAINAFDQKYIIWNKKNGNSV